MKTIHLVWASVLALALSFVLVTACSSSSSSCTIGKESCPCTQGGACDPGLACKSNQCVRLDGGGAGGGSTTTNPTTTTGNPGTGGSTGTGGSQGTGGAGGGLPPGDGGPTSDLGKACAGPADCTGGLQCVKSTDTTWLNQGGPAKGYCSLPCMTQSTCAPFGGLCVDMSALATDPPNPWCLQLCSWGGASDAATRAAKCHGRADVACYKPPATDAGAPPSFCSPTCSQDADCGTRKCDPISNVCVDMPSMGLALGAKCDPNNDQCGGTCIPLTKAQFCSQPCVLGSINQCNHTAGAVGMDAGTGAHGLCALQQTGAAAGDLGFCSQECEAVADCSDKTDPGGTCDLTVKMVAGHGVCTWP